MTLQQLKSAENKGGFSLNILEFLFLLKHLDSITDTQP